MSFETEANKTRSKKNILAIARSREILKFFNLVGSNIYEKQVSHFVDAVKINNTILTYNANSSINNTYRFTPETMTLSVTTSTNIDLNNLVVTYKHFFSNYPITIPNDFSTGAEVYFEPRLEDIGELKLELDFESNGQTVALESASSITLSNNDGFFDGIFDTHIWENQNVEFYFYFENQPLSEIKLVYKGVIENKSFNPKNIKFNLKDRFYSLRKSLNLNLYSLADGSFDESLIDKPKRRIYGQLSRLKTVSVSQMKDNFSIAGTVSGVAGLQTITGTSTEFLKYISPGDNLTINGKEISVSSVDSNTQLTASEPLKYSFESVSFACSSDTPNRYFNRRWSIAGHALCEASRTITAIESSYIVTVADSSDFESGDVVEIGSNTYTVRRIFNGKIYLNQTFISIPSIGNTIKKVPCFNAYYNGINLVYNRDYTLENNSNHSVLVINSNAEENIFLPKLKPISLVFTNGSRVVTSSSNLKNDFSNRWMIKPSSINYSTYYEILEVRENQIILRAPFAETTITDNVLCKEVEWIADDSIVCVDCYGKGTTNWLRFPGEIVKDILENDGGETITNSSFEESSSMCPVKMSVCFPENIGDNSPNIKDCITKINGSVFGSLYYDNNFEFKYSILNATKPLDIKELYEDDVIGYDSITKNNIIGNVSLSYRPENNTTNGDLFQTTIYRTGTFAPLMSGITKQKEIDTLIFNESDAENMAQRVLFFNSMTSSVVKIKGKLNLSTLNLNDAIKLNFDRIYKRYGGKNRTKIGIISSITKDDSTSTIEVNDMSGIFNRVGSIAPNTQSDFAHSADGDIAKYCFIVDNINTTPNNNQDFVGSNLIG